MRNDKYQMIIRFSPEEKKKLDFVVKAYGISMTELIKGYIDVDYDNLIGKPELKKALEDLNRIQEILEPYQKG